MDDVLTRNENEELAVRTVGSTGDNYVNKDDVYTRDDEGKLAVRVVGSGGSIDEDRVIIKSAEIPEASADELGKFYCYSGTTNATYTHGYVYECVEGQPTYTDSVEFEPATISETVVTTTSNSLANLCSQYITGDITSIVSGTMTYDESGEIWAFVGKDAEDNTVGSFQLYTQDFIDAGFTFTGTLEDGDVVAFTCTITESSTYVWERIDLQPEPELGRYLSTWNCATGLAGTNPPVSPYTYKTGDYFIVGTVATGGANNYRPNGSSYTTGQASSTVETNSVAINDTYFYDGTNWSLLKTGSAVTSVNGQTGDVTVQETLVSGTNIKTINGNSILGSGDMQISGFLPFPAGWTTNTTTKALCDDIAADTTTVKGSAFLGEVTCSDLPAGIVNSEINVYINDGTTAANKVIILELTSGNVAPYRWIYVYWNGGTDTSGWKTWQETLVSGVNIKTINGTSLLGSGNITTEAIQVSTMPTAGASEEGKIYQFIGTTDANYTNGYFYKCVSDGGNPATYSWERVDVQPAVDPLPSQAGNAGKVLTTNGTNASWTDITSTPATTPTLVAANWSNNSQTINVTGVTANNVVLVSPTPVSADDYAAAGVLCVAQATGQLTFTCTTTPLVDLTVNIVCF